MNHIRFKIPCEINKSQEWKAYLCAFEVYLPTHIEQFSSEKYFFIHFFIFISKSETNENYN